MNEQPKYSIVWDLVDLKKYNGTDIYSKVKKVNEQALNFKIKYKGLISKLSYSDLLSSIKNYELIISELYPIAQYVNLEYYISPTEYNKKRKSFIDTSLTNIFNHTLFYNIELGGLNKSNQDNILNSQLFQDYKYMLERIFKLEKYNLNESEEKIIGLMSDCGSRAFCKLYNDLTSEFTFKIKIDNKTKELNGSELRALRYNSKQSIRREAMSNFFSKYANNSTVIGSIYNNILANYYTTSNVRNYTSTIERRNIDNDLDNYTVDIINKATNDSYYLIEKYYSKKSNLLNLNSFGFSDIYASINIKDNSYKYSWDECKDIVLNAFKEFDIEFYTIAKELLDSNRVHASILKNKKGGAFCSTSIPSIKPYIMINFLGNLRDITTLAHELGHAIHYVLSSSNNIFNYHASLPIAETASVFCEMIVTEYLLKNEPDNDKAKFLLTQKIDDIIATSHRQNMFFNFELNTHKLYEKYKFISVKDLSKLYFDELNKMFGKSITYNEDYYKYEWMSIPHIFEYPFYVYSYNFGNLLVISLYQQYKVEGNSFIPKLKSILSTGSSKSPKYILKSLNLDINDINFWNNSFKYIESLISKV